MKKREKADIMVSYMNEKYTDDSFIYRNVTGGSMGSNVYTILVESEKYPQKPINVSYTELEGETLLSDNYLAVKYEDETAKYLSDAIKNSFGENFYLEYSCSTHAKYENGSSDTTFEEFIAEKSSDVFFKAVIYCTVEDEEILFEKLKTALADTTAYGYVYFADENVDLRGENAKETAVKYIEERKYSKRIHFIKNSVSDYKTVDWKDGV